MKYRGKKSPADRNTRIPQAVACWLPCLLACQYTHIESAVKMTIAKTTWPKEGSRPRRDHGPSLDDRFASKAAWASARAYAPTAMMRAMGDRTIRPSTGETYSFDERPGKTPEPGGPRRPGPAAGIRRDDRRLAQGSPGRGSGVIPPGRAADAMPTGSGGGVRRPLRHADVLLGEPPERFELPPESVVAVEPRHGAPAPERRRRRGRRVRLRRPVRCRGRRVLRGRQSPSGPELPSEPARVRTSRGARAGRL